MDKFSRIDDCVAIGKNKMRRLLFAYDLVLLASYEPDLPHALDGFATACDIALMKISTTKTEVLRLLKNSVMQQLRS